jgi:ABC-2 type transport system ATP-binding protein
MTPVPQPVIEAHGLVKSFGRTRALDGLDLVVQPGEVAGFLGPNGAGKSTTIRVLLGLLRPDRGSGPARLFGADPWGDAVRLHTRLAYVPGEVSLWPSLTGGETIDLIGRLRGGLDRARRDELVERFELDPAKKARTYSKGNRQKIALIAALASDAELLVLDEPTSGLDPLMEAVFTECVAEAHRAGRTVLLSSHILSEVEKLCDTVTIIRAGRTVEAGPLDRLTHLARSTVRFVTRRDPAALAAVPGVHDLVVDDDGRTCFTVEPAHLGAALEATARLDPQSLTCQPPSLEDIFLSHYRTELQGDGVPVAPDGGPHLPAAGSAGAASPGWAEGAGR